MDPLRPLSAVSALPTPVPASPVAPPPGPADSFQPAASLPAAMAPAPPVAPEPPELEARILGPARSGGLEEVRVFANTARPVPVRDGAGRLSFVFPSQEGNRTRVQRVDSDGTVRYSFLLPPTSRESLLAVDVRGGRLYGFSQGRLQAFDLEDGREVAALDVESRQGTFQARAGGGLFLGAPDRLGVLDRDLRLEREIPGSGPQSVVEGPGGAMAVRWGDRSTTVVDAAGRTTASFDQDLRRLKTGPDGALWAFSGDPWDRDVSVLRIDPATGATRRLPGVPNFEDLYPRADGSYLVHARGDLTAFALQQFSADGVEQGSFRGQGKLELLELSPEGDCAWGLVSDWQAEPAVNRLVRYDLERPSGLVSGLLATLGTSGSGEEVYREVPDRSGRTNAFIPVAMEGGRVAIAGLESGALLDREGGVLTRYDSAEALVRAVDPQGLREAELRHQTRVLVPDGPAAFGRSQGGFEGVGGLHFSRAVEAGSLPEAAGLDAATNEARMKGSLFGAEDLPQKPAPFPQGLGRFWLEDRDGCLVVEVPDPATPGAFVRRSFMVDEFERFTNAMPVSASDGGSYVVATDDRGRVHWMDAARGSDQLFPLEGGTSLAQSGENRILVTGAGGRLLVLDMPGQTLRTPKGQRLDVPEDEQPRILSSETTVRVGSISLPIRS